MGKRDCVGRLGVDGQDLQVAVRSHLREERTQVVAPLAGGGTESPVLHERERVEGVWQQHCRGPQRKVGVALVRWAILQHARTRRVDAQTVLHAEAGAAGVSAGVQSRVGKPRGE